MLCGWWMSGGMFQMNRQNLRKILFFSMLLCSMSSLSQGQMIDLIGSMGVGGVQTTESLKGVRQMNNALHGNQVLNELQLNIADISTTYFNGFQRMSKRTVTVGNVKIIYRPVDNGQHYEAYITPVSRDLCSTLLNARLGNLVRYRLVNGGSSRDYTMDQVRGNSGLCVTTDAIALILQ